MKFLLHNISLPVDYDERSLICYVPKSITNDVVGVRLFQRSVDARKKNNIVFNATLLVEVVGNTALYPAFELPKNSQVIPGNEPLNEQPVVVGTGPAGLFCAYLLSEYGFKPVILERGKPVEEREKDFEALKAHRNLNPESNVCFGEGGAGAFSDGKLTTRIKDSRVQDVLSTLIRLGAPEEIRFVAKPHLGTDVVRKVVVNMRKHLIQRGATFCFGKRLHDLIVQDGRVVGYRTDEGHKIETSCIVLAIGHSARDTYAMLHRNGVTLDKKPFAVGVRIEHQRQEIERAQLGPYAGHNRLFGEYHLTHTCDGRGVYTFCMCPGGEVVDSSTEEGYTCVNGMSYFARDGVNSNSAVVVAVGTDDLPDGALGGIEFQRMLEKSAYHKEGIYVQRLGDFLKGNGTKHFGSIRPTVTNFLPGDINRKLPEYITNGLKQGFLSFDKKLKGFAADDALLTLAETRTSSPVRIVRGENMQSVSVGGLYPCGEGSGYAGGIVSSAVDGLKAAQVIIETYKPK